MKTLKRWWPAALWAAIIFVLCSIPGKDIPSAGWMHAVSLDKWVHFIMFAVLSILVLHALRRSSGRDEYWPFQWWWIGVVVLYGALTEGYQHWFLEDCYADVYDFVANTLGALVGTWIYHRYHHLYYRRVESGKTF